MLGGHLTLVSTLHNSQTIHQTVRQPSTVQEFVKGALRNSLFKSFGKFQGNHMRQRAIFVTFQVKNGKLNGTY